MALFYILSGLAFYFFASRKFGQKIGLISSTFYLFAPYHLIDLHYRVALGELAAFIFLPLCLLFADLKRFKLLSLSICLLVLSHQAISLFFIPMLFVYCLVQKINVKFLLSSFILALSLSAFYWLPVITETKYTRQPIDTKVVEFWPMSSYIYSPWKLGLLWQGPYGKLTFPTGYLHLPLIILAVYIALKIRKNRFWVACFFLLFLLMQSFSKAFWQIIPLINNFQFTYRLMVIISFISAILAGIFFSQVKVSPFWTKTVLFLVIITSILAWSNRRVIPEITDQTLAVDLPLASTKYGEGFSPAVPKWVPLDKPWSSVIPLTHAEILSGLGKITSLSRTTNTHTYSVQAETPLRIQENTLYFPGWQLFANNQLVPIFPNHLGIITFSLPPGEYNIKLDFTDTPIRTFSKQTSLLSLLVLILLYVRPSAPHPD
ncbi:MAG: hypothetical protein G01um101416_1145 [Microgenomates group bacterium Gr01-1014_16]|nr:MAG: hypothetical protein G01um101416_1145 [Microgenomates group bacterium Gr01-1014_16]